jgi:signal transduction histidine kinase
MQVFRNLMDNAARHAKSTIMVGMERRPGEVVVSVDNDGEIISLKDRNRVFERFARLDASRSSDGGGSGLGLAISRDIMIAHRRDGTGHRLGRLVPLPSDLARGGLISVR